MSIIHAFSSGIRRATSEPKMIFVLYLLNLLLAIPLALAFRSVLVSGMGSSLAPAQMMPGLDFTVFQDFMNLHSANLQTVLGQVLVFLLLSMLLQTFLAGGMLTVLQDSQRKYSSSLFFKGCGTYFFRFFKLFLLFAVILLVVVLIVGLIVIALAEGMIENATSEVTEFWVRVATVKLVFLPVMLILMAADYAKIHSVLHDERSAFRSCGRGIAFVFRRFFAALGLELLMFGVGVILFAVYLWLDLSIGMTTVGAIILMFFIQQLFMFSRAWTKVFFFAGEMTLYKSVQALAVSDARDEAALPTAERA